MSIKFKILLLNFVSISAFGSCLTPHEVTTIKTCKPSIRILVPSTAGGTMDAFARELEQVLRVEGLGGGLSVVNRPGANGNIAAGEMVQRKDPCTFLLGSAATLSTNRLNRNLTPAINALSEFEPVALVAKNPLILIVNKEESKIKDLEDFVKRLKSGTLKYSSSGIGSINHLAVVKMEQDLGVVDHSVHAPGKGATEANQMMYSDDVDFVMDNPLTASALMRNEKMLVLGSSYDKPVLLGGKTVLPISRDEHFKNFSAEAWYGLVGSKSLDPGVKAAMTKASQCMVNNATIKAKFEKMGFSMQDGSPDSLKSLMTSEIKKWKPIFDLATRDDGAAQGVGTRKSTSP